MTEINSLDTPYAPAPPNNAPITTNTAPLPNTNHRTSRVCAPERHTNSELSSTLDHRVRDNAVNSNRCQDYTNRRKRPEQTSQQRDTPSPDRPQLVPCESGKPADSGSSPAIELRRLLPRSLPDSRKCADDREIRGSSLRQRDKRFKACIRLSQVTRKGEVINYADDFKILLLWTSTTDALSNRTFVGPKVRAVVSLMMTTCG
jgi:hypothetical protein